MISFVFSTKATIGVRRRCCARAGGVWARSHTSANADYGRQLIEVDTQQKIDNQWIGSATTIAYSQPSLSSDIKRHAPMAVNKVVSNKVLFDTVLKYLQEHVPRYPICVTHSGTGAGKDCASDTKSYLIRRLNTNQVSLNSYFTNLLGANSIPIESASRKYISNRISQSSINSFRHDGAVSISASGSADSSHSGSASLSSDAGNVDTTAYIPEVDTHLHRFVDMDTAAGRLLSKLYTFPLSLALGLRVLCDAYSFPPRAAAGTGAAHPTLKLLMVGARSECTLPRFMWKEALVALGNVGPSFSQRRCEGTAGAAEGSPTGHGKARMEVTFIGPGLPVVTMKAPAGVQPLLPPVVEWVPELLPTAASDMPLHLTEVSFSPLLPQYQCLLHTYCDPKPKAGGDADVVGSLLVGPSSAPLEGIWRCFSVTPDARRLVDNSDVICMFNPGIGFSYEQAIRRGGSASVGAKLTHSQWFPSLVLVLLSLKPIVCTAHGPVDYARDMKYWRLAVDEINRRSEGERFELQVYYSSGDVEENTGTDNTSNPFGSCRWEIDKLDTSQPVLRPNSYLYVMQLLAVGNSLSTSYRTIP